METYTFGDINADMVLLQAVDDHDLEGLDNEVKLIGEMTGSSFCRCGGFTLSLVSGIYRLC